MQTYRIANVNFLVLSQSLLNARRSDCQEALATNCVNDAISVMPVSERGFRLIDHCEPHSVTLLAIKEVLPIVSEFVCAILITILGVPSRGVADLNHARIPTATPGLLQ